MCATTKESLKALLADLVASVDALPADIFSDEPTRKRVQEQISGLRAAVDTPPETIFNICLQVSL